MTVNVRLSEYHYLIALGSNRRHVRYGGPGAVLKAAFAALNRGQLPIRLVATSSIATSRPLGPSQRSYANAAAVIETTLTPPALLAQLKQVERDFGRRHSGQRWAARVLDLDIILWSGGIWASKGLGIPHPEFAKRSFVLQPATQIAAKWRDPLTGRTIRQLRARLDRRQPIA